MFNKNDPLIGAVQQVMQKNAAEREATRAVNEKFGVTDRKAVPHERQNEWDAAFKKIITEGVEGTIPKTPKEKNLAAMHGDKNRITHGDVLKARGVVAEETPDEVGKNENEGGSAVTTTAPAKPKAITPNQQNALKSKIQSIMKEAAEKRMNEGAVWDSIKSGAAKAWNAVKAVDRATSSDLIGKAATATGAAADTNDTMGKLATATGATAVNKWLNSKSDSSTAPSTANAAEKETGGKNADISAALPDKKIDSAAIKKAEPAKIDQDLTKKKAAPLPKVKPQMVIKKKAAPAPANKFSSTNKAPAKRSRLQSRSERDGGVAGPGGRTME